MGISIIVAKDENDGIGANNQLLCHLSDDLKYFKKMTQGHTVIMGKNTFSGLPNGALPNRKNIVLSHSKEEFKNCTKYGSVDECLNSDDIKNGEEVFVMGGASVYKAFFDISDKLYVTLIHHKFENADVFFPEIKEELRKLISQGNRHEADENNEYPFTFQVYERKK